MAAFLFRDYKLFKNFDAVVERIAAFDESVDIINALLKKFVDFGELRSNTF